MPPKINELGNTYGNLAVIADLGPNSHGKVCWLCECACGSYTVAVGSDLRQGKHKACSCKQRVHGLRNHPLYQTWRNIITRCYNQRSSSYKDYGGRGIRVCLEWRESPTEFIKWAETNGLKEGLQVDRVNNDGDYSASNCRVVTPQVNANNTRTRVDNKTGVTGVHFDSKKGKFIAQISSVGIDKGKRVHIGAFDTLEAATDARVTFIRTHKLINKEA